MLQLLGSFLFSLGFLLFIAKFSYRWALDSVHGGPQKFHKRPTPRLGGLGIYLSLWVTWWIYAWRVTPSLDGFMELLLEGLETLKSSLVQKEAPDLTQSSLIWGGGALLTAFPVFLGGIVEDITRKLLPRYRLGLALLSAMAAALFGSASLGRLDVFFIDPYLQQMPLLGVTLGIFLLAGLTNAYNIIDGFNGLTAMVSVLVELAIFYVSYKNNDFVLMKLCMAGIGATLGFLFWNYPRGLIFLGDGGAYFLGFFNGLLSIWLVHRNPKVSAWFAFLIHLYPVTETLFSIYRRKVLHERPSVLPDALHFHSLIYRRLIRWVTQEPVDGGNDRVCTWRNSLTSTYLWALSLFTLAPAVLWWDSHWPLRIAAVFFVSLYVYLYRSVVRFKTPRFLVLRIGTRRGNNSAT